MTISDGGWGNFAGHYKSIQPDQNEIKPFSLGSWQRNVIFSLLVDKQHHQMNKIMITEFVTIC